MYLPKELETSGQRLAWLFYRDNGNEGHAVRDAASEIGMTERHLFKTLAKLRSRGLVVRVKKGTGNRPSVYRSVNPGNTTKKETK